MFADGNTPETTPQGASPQGGDNPAGSQDTPSGIEGTVKFKADKVWREVGPDEAYQRLSKSYAADERLRQAAEQRKELDEKAKTLARWEKLDGYLGKIQEGGDEGTDAYRQFAKEVGVPPEEVEGYLELIQKQFAAGGDPAGTPAETPAAASSLSHSQKATFARLEKFFRECDTANIEPIAAIDRLQKTQQHHLVEQSKEYFNAHLGKHPVLSHLMKGEAGQTIRKDAWGRFQRRVQSGVTPTDGTIDEVAKEIVSLLDVLDSAAAPRGTGPALTPPSGATPGSRLQPPTAPDRNAPEYKDDDAAFINAQIEYDRWRTEDAIAAAA